jgi:tripartite ATP-independent transporter DctP family solute receptor
MKKALSIALILSMVIIVFAGCAPDSPPASSGQTSSGASSQPAPSKEEPSKVYTLQIGHAQPETNPRHISLLAFKEMVEDKTNGGIIVEIFPAGQLGNEKEMVEAVKMGTLQGMRGGHFEYLQKALIFTLPFLCENAKQVEALMNSDFALEICEPAKEHDLIVLGIGDAGGFRHFSNNVRQIKKPEDLAGLKMRIPGMDTVDRTFKALGATTVNVPYADLYMALKTGVADGQENPAVNVEGMKFYEVQKYFTMVSYQFHPDPFWVNLDWFNSLPEDYQQILYECTKESMKVNNKAIAENEAAAIAVIENNAEVYYPTPEEIQAFRDAVEVVYDQYLEEGLITQEELDTMRRIVAEAK